MSTIRMLEDGPNEYWSSAKSPTPAQYRAITAAACRLLGLEAPSSRFDATTVLLRMRLAELELTPDQEVPAPW